MTVREVHEWLAKLPPRFQDAPFEAMVGSSPVSLKRIVAYTYKEEDGIGVVANPMGTHLPFDDSMNWHHQLNP